MPNWLKLIIGVVVGLVVGSIVNGSIISMSPHVIAPLPGADLQTEAGLKAAMAQMGPQHFLMPFLAHALGSLVGGFLATKIAPSYRAIPAVIVGAVFLGGGAYMASILPAPLWFEALDVIVAYLPAALLGYHLAKPRKPKYV